MARLANGRCPKCGAAVPLDASDYVTCAYCGSRAFVQRTGAAPPADVPVIVVPSHVPVVLALALGVLAVLVAGGAMLATTATREPAPPASRPAAAPLPPPPVVHAPEPPKPVEPAPPVPQEVRVLPVPAPSYLDVDADGAPEVIAAVSFTTPDARETALAVFDGRTGALRVRTPALELAPSTLAVAYGARVVVASPNGQLTGYDLGSGDAQWTTTLGDRVAAICPGAAPTALLVASVDERRVALDLVTGAQSESRARCETPLATSGSWGDPRDRRDGSAPPGVEAYHCGGVTVMGSGSFRVPDACATHAHVNTDRLDGMVGHRLWKHDAGWIVFGVRTPGTYVPMVGRLARGARFAWKSEVPATNPLEAEQGGPRYAALAGDVLVVGYDGGGEPRFHLTAFAVEDGARRFDVGLAEPSLHAISAAGEAVFVHAGDAVVAIDPSSGAVRFTVGVAAPAS